MGAIKKMIEGEIPGIYVLSLMIGKNVIEVFFIIIIILNKHLYICHHFMICFSPTGHRKWIFHGCESAGVHGLQSTGSGSKTEGRIQRHGLLPGGAISVRSRSFGTERMDQ